MKVDLHVHSTYSDSSRSPDDICATAVERGIGLLSVCDHYTIDAYRSLQPACARSGVKVVLGVELDANWQGENFHVLAYNFDAYNAQMRRFIQNQKEKSSAECEQIVARMSADYPQMSLTEYRRYQRPYGRGGWKYIHYAVEKGAAATYEEASHFFGRYFQPDPRTFSLPDFCALVRQAEGVPVLAHPGYMYTKNPDGFRAWVLSMIECGIEGIECFYPSHTKQATETCLDLCRRNDLRITGGCDCHGIYDDHDGFTIGGIGIEHDMLDLKGIYHP